MNGCDPGFHGLKCDQGYTSLQKCHIFEITDISYLSLIISLLHVIITNIIIFYAIPFKYPLYLFVVYEYDIIDSFEMIKFLQVV